MGISKKSVWAFIATLLMVLTRVSSSTTVNADYIRFNFDHFPPDPEDLIIEDDAYPDSHGDLQLTKVSSNGIPQSDSVGRVLYSAPIHLWEKSAVATFETTFKFVIDQPPGNRPPGDGIAFFIAETNSSIGSAGMFLGLFPDADTTKNVVAVELDTYANPEIDPDYTHIGIDINHIRSKATTKWNVQKGKEGKAQISYKPFAKKLSAVVSYADGNSSTVSLDVDLKNILPEWVHVGLSASTGLYNEINTIRSWSFTSGLNTNKLQDLKIASVV